MYHNQALQDAFEDAEGEEVTPEQEQETLLNQTGTTGYSNRLIDRVCWALLTAADLGETLVGVDSDQLRADALVLADSLPWKLFEPIREAVAGDEPPF